MATKPYAAGGAYIDRMSDYCGGCRYDPRKRVGDDACPFTAGYWAFLDRNRERLAGNHRMRRPLAGLGRLRDLDAVVEQEALRGTAAPSPARGQSACPTTLTTTPCGSRTRNRRTPHGSWVSGCTTS